MNVIRLAATTTKKRGRLSDDMGSFVHTVVLAMLPTPGSTKHHCSREIAKGFGLSETTFWHAKKAKHLRAFIVLLDESSIMFSQVVKRKQWSTIMYPHVKAKSHDFIRRHPNVIVSPIKGDTVTVVDPPDDSKKIKVPKHLRQMSIKEFA